MSRRSLVLLAALATAGVLATAPAAAHPEHEDDTTKREQPSPSPLRSGVMQIGAVLAELAAPAGTAGSCVDGTAAGYPCRNVDLLSFVPVAELGTTATNDVWGWTHGPTEREFALVGTVDGVAFLEITDPHAPRHVGDLPTHTEASAWRDIKVHADHAYVVSEATGHGMQVFDLRRLLDVASPPATFTETAHYSGVGSAHNLAIDETAGYAYIVGAATCNGGLHAVDLSDPAAPSFSGCFLDDGYTHDAQCVVYHGPDLGYRGRQLCLAANEDTFTIVDVTDKGAMAIVARVPYPGSGYAHQGWLTADHRSFLLDDELDEWAFGTNTTTHIWDVTDLDAPTIVGTHVADTAAIDHNQYVVGSYTFQANYRAGLRVLDVDRAATGVLEEVGHFDVYPASDGAGFNGAWSVYPWFSDHVMVVTGIEQGLFVLRFTGTDAAAAHVHDVRAKPRPIDDERWRAAVLVKVRDTAGNAVAGARVSGYFGAARARTCTTNASGKCKVKVPVRSARPKIPFNVLAIDAPAGYDASSDRITDVVVRRPDA